MEDNTQTPTQEPPLLLEKEGGALQRWSRRAMSLLRLNQGSSVSKMVGGGALVILLLLWLLSMYWSREPNLFDVKAAAYQRAEQHNQLVDGKLVVGYVTAATLAEIATTLLEKPGGYVSNDLLPPTLMMDNMPAWEFGVLQQIRDFVKAVRNDMTRSQTQSIEDKDLAEADPKFNFDNSSWLFSEGSYRDGVEYLESYLKRLTDDNKADAQFLARADNLRDWLSMIGKRLGSLSQRLSASVGGERINIDLAGEPEGKQARETSEIVSTKTLWMDIDNVFYEARGTAWALIHLLRAIETDFKDVLENKNALASIQHIIRELEATQVTIWSPMILNGSEFGLFANHSLVMSSYISRANAAVIDLRSLLREG